MKKKILALFVLSCPVPALLLFSMGTSTPGNPKTVSLDRSHRFIEYEKNKIDFYGDRLKWDAYFSKMMRLVFSGEGHVSILHIGGSHVQAGNLTDRLRENLVTMADGLEAERGFIFPYKLAGTNSPSSIRTQYTGTWDGCRNALSTDHCDWGMSGINANCCDSSASFKVWCFNHDSANYFNAHIRVFHRGDNYVIEPDASIPVWTSKRRLDMDATDFYFAVPVDTLSFNIFRIDSLPGCFTLQGIYLGENADGITYNTIGVNGAGTYSYLRCEMLKDQLPAINPDLVIFGIGVNDANVPQEDFVAADYEARYDSLITIIKDVNPEACFLFITNNDTYYRKKYANRNAIAVKETMVRLAQKHDAAVFDMFTIMGGLGSISQWQDAGLAQADKIHLTREGYRLQADMMYLALREAFGNYLDRVSPK